MPRWKQTFTCPACRRTKWREVETEEFFPEPDPAELGRKARCRQCGHRGCEVVQVKLLPRYMDAMKPGGMRAGLIAFDQCESRDREVAEAIAQRAAQQAAVSQPSTPPL